VNDTTVHGKKREWKKRNRCMACHTNVSLQLAPPVVYPTRILVLCISFVGQLVMVENNNIVIQAYRGFALILLWIVLLISAYTTVSKRRFAGA